LKIKSQRDFWSGLMFVVVGVIFAVGATNYPLGASARPGPGYFPLMLSVIMAILGGVVLFKSLTIETEGGDPIGSIAWRPLLVIVAAITVFGLAGDEFHWKGVIANAVVLTVGAWAIFVLGLKLTIPMWPTVFGG
jgi:hypothetical protein